MIVRKYGLLTLGIAGAVVGAFLAIVPRKITYTGSYVPLSTGDYLPPTLTMVGIALLVAGLALVAGWIGFRLGRRSIK